MPPPRHPPAQDVAKVDVEEAAISGEHQVVQVAVPLLPDRGKQGQDCAQQLLLAGAGIAEEVSKMGKRLLHSAGMLVAPSGMAELASGRHPTSAAMLPLRQAKGAPQQYRRRTTPRM